MAMATTKNSLAKAILLLFLAAASSEAKHLGHAIRPFAHIGEKRDPFEKIFNVLHFGAKCNPRTDNALNFIKAWRAACDWRGKARLLIPAGEFLASEMVFAGPCKNTAPTIVQIVGTIKAVSDMSSYSEDSWMLFQNINGLIINGGIVDGQGPNVWKYHDGGGSVFPASIKFFRVTNGVIRMLHSVNPMGFHIGIVLCENIRVTNIRLDAPDDSPNTDGIHLSQTHLVKITRSVIATGDDCVGMIHGCTDITIKKLTCGPGHGISIGSLGKYPDEKEVKGITVTNCTLKNTDNGLRIKTWAGSPPSCASGMTFQDIIMKSVKNPIIIDQSYGSESNEPSKVKISDVKFLNVRGTTVSEVGVKLECSKKCPCEGVQLSNIDLHYVGDKKKPISSVCQNAKIKYAGRQLPPPCN
ncbi:hypothetical protein JCGZ_18921 [Jatropha curcas]|uniref:Exopolygalacturonase-like n=1 Tax=Jatropha curcas TaxID=180498 RepID=A0A067JV49_JATCU|nr:exopolygalacturonase clone GBGE184 [Jatropha curcas]KDP27841.1 hypothetical protein JCGZ_18921 [Jatropha curcas]